MLLSNIFLLFSATSQPAPCPHGWVNRGSSCYAFITDVPATWTEAEVHCNLMQSRLVEIETVVEDEFLEVHLLNGGFKGDFWIGLSDILVEGEWVWMSTQKVAQYTNWWPGEPNNLHSPGEDCAALTGRLFHWNDFPCLWHRNFICEKEAHGHEQWVVVG